MQLLFRRKRQCKDGCRGTAITRNGVELAEARLDLDVSKEFEAFLLHQLAFRGSELEKARNWTKFWMALCACSGLAFSCLYLLHRRC